MFGLSPMELMVIAVAALLVLGPEGIPPMLYQLGKLLGQLRRMGDVVREQVEQAADLTQSPPRPPPAIAPQTPLPPAAASKEETVTADLKVPAQVPPSGSVPLQSMESDESTLADVPRNHP